MLKNREDLDALPYLNAVTMEILRTNAVATWVIRKATKDAIVPLETPVLGRDGKMMDHFEVSKGTNMNISILPMNVDADYWGEDAEEFK
jgi:cytochrome P450